VLKRVLPADGRALRGWLQDPIGTISALSFLPDMQGPLAVPEVVGSSGREQGRACRRPI